MPRIPSPWTSATRCFPAGFCDNDISVVHRSNWSLASMATCRRHSHSMPADHSSSDSSSSSPTASSIAVHHNSGWTLTIDQPELKTFLEDSPMKLPFLGVTSLGLLRVMSLLATAWWKRLHSHSKNGRSGWMCNGLINPSSPSLLGCLSVLRVKQ